MTTQITFELRSDAMLAAIDRALATLTAPRELMVQIGDRLEQNAQQRFDSKTDPSGKAWAPLKQSTKDIYGSDFFIKDNPAFKGGIPGTLLERTRQLRNSLAYNAGVDYVEIGTSRATKGGRWQVGSLMETGTKNMPARRILTADPAAGKLGAGEEADILAIVSKSLGAAFG
jgi:phage gpG-like protein